MVRIRRFSVLRTATVAAAMYFIITAIFAIPLALIASAMPSTYTDQFGRTYQVSISPLFVLIIPFVYAGLGWVFTALACLIYNLAARFTGGIQFEAVAVTPAPPAQVQPSSQAPSPAPPSSQAPPPATPSGS